MDILDVVTGVLVALVIFDWVSVAILFFAGRRARRAGNPVHSLHDRARTAALIGVGSTIAAFLGLNRHFGFGLAPELGIALLVAAVTVPSLANLWFLIDLARGEFGA